MSEFKNRNRLIQIGAPVKGLCSDFDIARSLKSVSYMKGSREKIISKEQQLEMWQELLDFVPDEYSAPIIVISSPNNDRYAIRKALDALDIFLEKNYRVRWHIMNVGYPRRSDIIFNSDVLFISNVVSTSTPHKIEQLRDILSLNHKSLRIIVTAGWHGKDLADAAKIQLNGLIHLGRLVK